MQLLRDLSVGYGIELYMIPLAALKRFNDHVDKRGPDECWPWTGNRDPCGYGKVCVNGKYVGTHRVALQLAQGEIAPGLCALHTCDSRACCNPAHLYVGTHAQNMADMKKRGRANPPRGDAHPSRNTPGWSAGERNGRAKLNWGQVREIRRRFAEGEMRAELAREFNVSGTALGDIVSGRHWKEPL